MFGLKLEVIVNSEQRRKPKKAKINIASNVRAVLVEWYPRRSDEMHLASISIVMGCLVSGRVG